MEMRTDYQPPPRLQPISLSGPKNNPEYETSWRSKFPKLVVLILSIIQLVFIIIIFALEIASLSVLSYRGTGVGIWCAIAFLPACILIFILVRKKDGSRKWATIVLIAQLVLLIFSFVLIGITGNYVQTTGTDYYSYLTYLSSVFYSGTPESFNSYQTKYHLTQAELAFGILLMFSGFTYVGIYIFVTFLALWQPFHTLDLDHLFKE